MKKMKAFRRGICIRRLRPLFLERNEFLHPHNRNCFAWRACRGRYSFQLHTVRSSLSRVAGWTQANDPDVSHCRCLFFVFFVLLVLGSKMGLRKKFLDRVVPPPKVRWFYLRTYVRKPWLIAAAEKNILINVRICDPKLSGPSSAGRSEEMCCSGVDWTCCRKLASAGHSDEHGAYIINT